MTKYQVFGFFQELRHGRPGGESIHHALANPTPEAERIAVATYLRSGSVVAATSQRTDDAIDRENTNVSPINIHSDGYWVWPEDAAYYVEKHGIGVPDDLRRRAALGAADEVDDDTMMDIITWIQRGMPRADS